MVALATVACAGGSTGAGNAPGLAELPAGDPVVGEALFAGNPAGAGGEALVCKACHSLDGTARIGPSLQGISQRIPDGYESAEAYLYESIMQPDAYVREGDDSHIMPPEMGRQLTSQELADLIAFLSQR
jgi:cytochrome c553